MHNNLKNQWDLHSVTFLDLGIRVDKTGRNETRLVWVVHTKAYKWPAARGRDERERPLRVQ